MEQLFSPKELRLIQHCVSGYFIKYSHRINPIYSDACLSVLGKIDSLLYESNKD